MASASQGKYDLEIVMDNTPLSTDSTVKSDDTLPANLNQITVPQDANRLSVMPRRSQADIRRFVHDRRRTLGPGFATAGLIMAVKSQFDVLNTQAGIADTDISDEPEDPQRKNSFFYQEVYAPFMETLFEDDSSVSKINAHARTLPWSERFFFCLMILVMFIYALGIITAVIMLTSIMWYR